MISLSLSLIAVGLPVLCGRSFVHSSAGRQWIESYAVHYHLSPSVAGDLTPLLRAGDDATNVKWLLATETNPELQQLYSSHRPILQMALRRWREKQLKKSQRQEEEPESK